MFPRLASRSMASMVALCVGLFTQAADAAKCPNVHFVLDRSGSMSSTVPGAGTRWNVAKAAVNKVLDKWDGQFPIGMSIFPPSGGSGCGSDLVTPPDYKTKAKIKAAIDANGPSGGTPSGSAMRDAQAIKEMRDPDRKQYVVFITDGGPGCSGEPDSCSGTVGMIRQAASASPSIATFVVGFGGGLGSSEIQCLTQMADAGGKPATTPERFYKADNAEDLNKALTDILEIITGGGDVGSGGVCDDTCYSNGCPTPGDLCVKGECRANPCSGVTCGAKNSYCSSDGTTPGICVSACTKPCAKGTRCDHGACAPYPCPYFCAAGLVCDTTQKRCVPDALCQGLPPDKQCKGTARCQSGTCVDDPCRWTRCPTGTRCVNWDGSCELIVTEEPLPDDNKDGEFDGGSMRGCSAVPGGAGGVSLSASALLLLFLLAARRRRSR